MFTPRKLISCVLSICLLPVTQVHAQLASPVGGELVLPVPGKMVTVSPAFKPPVLKGIKVYPDNPFRFDFVLDQGVIASEAKQSLNEESTKLIKYFLASLTTPEKDLWVNLSPYEKNRIVPDSFGQTEMGRDLLAQDYLLKQLTASLVYPEGDVGREFWKRVYQEANRQGVIASEAKQSINTFNKVWIVPNKAVVYENAKTGTAYVVESSLKVLTEQDYLAKTMSSPNSLIGDPATSKVVRDIVLPQLTKEVNEGANFAQLRQVYNSLILATWYKKKIKNSILNQVFAEQNKINGLSYKSVIPAKAGIQRNGSPIETFGDDKEAIYNRYLQAFKKGAYNYIKEEADPVTHQITPRKYFSGGVQFGQQINQAMSTVKGVTSLNPQGLSFVQVNITPNAAMLGETHENEDFVEAISNMPFEKVYTEKWLTPENIQGVNDRELKEYLDMISQADLATPEYLARFSFGTTGNNKLYDALLENGGNIRDWIKSYAEDQGNTKKGKRNDRLTALIVALKALNNNHSKVTYTINNINAKELTLLRKLLALAINVEEGMISYKFDGMKVIVEKLHPEGLDGLIDALNQLRQGLVQISAYIDHENYADQLREYYEEKIILDPKEVENDFINERIQDSSPYVALGVLWELWNKHNDEIKERISDVLNRAILDIDSFRSKKVRDDMERIYRNFAAILPEGTALRDVLVIDNAKPLQMDMFDAPGKDEAMISRRGVLKAAAVAAGSLMIGNLLVNKIGDSSEEVIEEPIVPHIALFGLSHMDHDILQTIGKNIVSRDVNTLTDAERIDLRNKIMEEKDNLDRYMASIKKIADYLAQHPEIKVIAFEGLSKPSSTKDGELYKFTESKNMAVLMKKFKEASEVLWSGQDAERYFPYIVASYMPMSEYLIMQYPKNLKKTTILMEDPKLLADGLAIAKKRNDPYKFLNRQLLKKLISDDTWNLIVQGAHYHEQLADFDKAADNIKGSPLLVGQEMLREIILEQLDQLKRLTALFRENTKQRNRAWAKQIVASKKNVLVGFGVGHTDDLKQAIEETGSGAGKTMNVTVEARDPIVINNAMISRREVIAGGVIAAGLYGISKISSFLSKEKNSIYVAGVTHPNIAHTKLVVQALDGYDRFDAQSKANARRVVLKIIEDNKNSLLKLMSDLDKAYDKYASYGSKKSYFGVDGHTFPNSKIGEPSAISSSPERMEQLRFKIRSLLQGVAPEGSKEYKQLEIFLILYYASAFDYYFFTRDVKSINFIPIEDNQLSRDAGRYVQEMNTALLGLYKLTQGSEKYISEEDFQYVRNVDTEKYSSGREIFSNDVRLKAIVEKAGSKKEEVNDLIFKQFVPALENSAKNSRVRSDLMLKTARSIPGAVILIVGDSHRIHFQQAAPNDASITYQDKAMLTRRDLIIGGVAATLFAAGFYPYLNKGKPIEKPEVPQIRLFGVSHPGQAQQNEINNKLVKKTEFYDKETFAIQLKNYLRGQKAYLDAYDRSFDAFAAHLKAHPEFRVIAFEGLVKPAGSRETLFNLNMDDIKERGDILKKAAVDLWGEKEASELLPYLMMMSFGMPSYFYHKYKDYRKFPLVLLEDDQTRMQSANADAKISVYQHYFDRMMEYQLIKPVINKSIQYAYGAVRFDALDKAKAMIENDKDIKQETKQEFLIKINESTAVLKEVEQAMDARNVLWARRLVESGYNVAVLGGAAHMPGVKQNLGSVKDKKMDVSIELDPDKAMNSKWEKRRDFLMGLVSAIGGATWIAAALPGDTNNEQIIEEPAVPEVPLFGIVHAGQPVIDFIQQYVNKFNSLDLSQREAFAASLERQFKMDKDDLDQIPIGLNAFADYVKKHPEIKVLAIEGVRRSKYAKEGEVINAYQGHRSKIARADNIVKKLWDGDKLKEMRPYFMMHYLGNEGYLLYLYPEFLKKKFLYMENDTIIEESSAAQKKLIEYVRYFVDQNNLGRINDEGLKLISQAINSNDISSLKQAQQYIVPAWKDTLTQALNELERVIVIHQQALAHRNAAWAKQVIDANKISKKHIAIMFGGAHTRGMRQELEKQAKQNGLNIRVSNPFQTHYVDAAMQVRNNLGGIDFKADQINLDITGSPIKTFGDDNGIKFKMDPAQLAAWQNATGATPVIINIKPLPLGEAGVRDLKLFLGIQ